MTLETFSILYCITMVIYKVCKIYINDKNKTKSINKTNTENYNPKDEYAFYKDKSHSKRGKVFIRSNVTTNNGKDCKYNRILSPIYSNYTSIKDIQSQALNIRHCKPFMDLLKEIYEDNSGTIFNDTHRLNQEYNQKIHNLNNLLPKSLNNVDFEIYINTMDRVKNNKTYKSYAYITIKNKQITNIFKAYKEINPLYNTQFVDKI